MTVLVLTHPLDVTTDLVMKQLDGRASVFRCDTADFPPRLQVVAASSDGAWSGTLTTAHRTVVLSDITAVYYRRPTGFTLPDSMGDSEREWAHEEALHGLGGVLVTLPCRWVNHPHRNAAAEYKPLQLATAAKCGLQVPRTLITNDPDAAAEFVAECPSGAVYKPLTGGVRDAGLTHFTTAVTAEQVGQPGTAHTAHQIQERVKKAYEVRLTVVGGRMFPARIDTGSQAAELDWRSDYRSVTYQHTTLPPAVANGVRRLMVVLGLRFGAVDFIVTPDAEWVFLEINPNGQWAWIQHHTGLRIAEAIADDLIEGEQP